MSTPSNHALTYLQPKEKKKEQVKTKEKKHKAIRILHAIKNKILKRLNPSRKLVFVQVNEDISLEARVISRTKIYVFKPLHTTNSG